MAAAPQRGDFVRVRTRRWLVEGERSAGAGLTALRLACVDDDALGEVVVVLWDAELDGSVLQDEGWGSVAKLGTVPLARQRKGVVHLPASHDLDSRDRDALLTAIAKARSWMDDLIEGRVQSFDEIVDREQKVVRHIRFLVPLAFLSPRIVAAIANGDVPAGVTVSGLVRSLSFNWAEQQRRFALL